MSDTKPQTQEAQKTLRVSAPQNTLIHIILKLHKIKDKNSFLQRNKDNYNCIQENMQAKSKWSEIFNIERKKRQPKISIPCEIILQK